MAGLTPLVHLACDGVMPLWLAREYGLPPRAGLVRYLWLHPTARSARKVQVYYLAWSPGEAALGPRAARHGLMTAVARYALGASPEAWDSLAVRSRRRTLRGRTWAKRMGREGRLREVPRPDAEWWWDSWASDPWAVELDTGRLPVERMASRLLRWSEVYAGSVWLTPSEARAHALASAFQAVVARRYWAWPIRVLLLPRWWESGEVKEVWRWRLPT
ncbi:hypothetical protein [Thermus sp.]|uniref:hypothetical protein n=1 Tax=Thermus sp. TaxID=275 RepID=UPI003D13F2F7